MMKAAEAVKGVLELLLGGQHSFYYFVDLEY